MRTRPVQDKHDDRSPHLVQHSGLRQQDSGVGWGSKSVGRFRMVVRAHFRTSFLQTFLHFPPCHENFSNAGLSRFILLHHGDLIGTLDLGYIGITNSVVFRGGQSSGTCVQIQGTFIHACIYGGIGGRSTVQISSVV